jgi:hypothetical protein
LILKKDLTRFTDGVLIGLRLRRNRMILTPVLKGQLTKASKLDSANGNRFRAVRKIFEKVMPTEQAKHAARKHLA